MPSVLVSTCSVLPVMYSSYLWCTPCYVILLPVVYSLLCTAPTCGVLPVSPECPGAECAGLCGGAGPPRAGGANF